jgi:hypothetical protein
LRSAVENVVRNAVRYTADHTAVEISLGIRGIKCTASGEGPRAGSTGKHAY